MDSQLITLFSQNDDSNTNRLAASLQERGEDVQVLWFGLPRNHYEIHGDLWDPVLQVGDVSVSSSTFHGPNRALLMRVGLNPQTFLGGVDSEFASREWDALLGGVITSWESTSAKPWLLGSSNYRLKDSKVQLLQTAARLGAPIPKSIVYSDLAAADLSDRRWVAKGMNAWEEIDPDTFFNTRLLSKADLARLTELSPLPGPLLLQSYLEHQTELRIYIAGSERFAVEIRSTDDSIVDFRLHDRRTASASIVAVPNAVESLADKIMNEFGLTYCVFDVIRDRQDSLWLVDINPLGVWDYLENAFDLVLTEKISNGVLSL